MMKRFQLCAVGLLVSAFALTQQAQAAITLSIDMDTTTAGVQDTLAVNAGDQITVGLVLTSDGADLLSGYSFGIRFDRDELAFVSRTTGAGSLPPGFGDLSGGPDFLDGTDDSVLGPGNYTQVRNWAAGTFGGVGAGTWEVGTVTLDVLAGVNNDALFDITAGLYNPAVDEFRDNLGDNIDSTVTFNPGKLSAVPEPGSFAALGVCLGSGLLWRRRKAKKG